MVAQALYIFNAPMLPPATVNTSASGPQVPHQAGPAPWPSPKTFGAKNPGAALRKAKGAPIAVLNHNEPSFYVVQPEVMQRLADELQDRNFAALIMSRRTSAASGNTVEVSVDDL
jgi:antitoxin StbD